MTDHTDRLLTVREAAAYVRLNPETIRRWLRSGKLAGTHLGSDRGGWRISQRDLDAFLHNHRTTAQETPNR